MREILIALNREAGIAGSMVITPDGIMVAAALGSDLEEETVAAFASGLLLGLKRSLSILRASGELNSCTLHASKGRITFFDMKNCYLVVVADATTKLDGSLGAIQAAMDKIRNRRVA
jgi:predicted regulator of Ras-like GTPase activity (Roadblock/LC7/MglB family)